MTELSVVLSGAGLALGMLMCVAGAAKLRAPRVAVAAILGYGLLPAGVARHLALPLAALELLAGVLVAWPGTRRAGAALVLAMLCSYTLAVASMLARGRAGEDCGCGGIVGGIPLGTGLLLRNLGLCALALACVALDAPAPQRAAQWAAAAGIGLAGWLLLTAIDMALARERMLADD